MVNKVAIVTGASRGVGRATATRLARAGICVFLAARNVDDLNQVAMEINSDNGNALAIPTDVTQAQSVQNLVDQVVKETGQIDLLVNNAGVGIFESVVDSNPDNWQSVIQSNLTSIYLCSKAVLPIMLDKKSGQIINILSVAAQVAFPFASAYCAAKAGALALSNVLREEVRSEGVRVTAVLPGSINSSFWDKMEQHPDLDLMLKPHHLADTILQLAMSPVDMTVESVTVTPPLGIL